MKPCTVGEGSAMRRGWDEIKFDGILVEAERRVEHCSYE